MKEAYLNTRHHRRPSLTDPLHSSPPCSPPPAPPCSAASASSPWALLRPLGRRRRSGPSRRTQRKAAPIRRDTRAQRACRAARAHGSVRACEWHGERSNRPALTRPTGCGRAVVLAPACAAIRARARFARRLGTARRRPLPAGLHAAPSPQAASFGRGGRVTGSGRRKSHPLSTPLEKGRSPTFSVAASGVGGGVRARAAFPGKLQPREWSYGQSSCSRLAGS